MATAVPRASYGPTMRDVLTSVCRKRFPSIALKNDYYLFILSGVDDRMVQSYLLDDDIDAYIDNLFAYQTAGRADLAEALLLFIGNMLDRPAERMNGVEPPSGFNGADSGVFILQIPRSDFSIRLFPGNPAEQVYCLDFVLSDTYEPANSPFEFELWAVPGPSFEPKRVISIEEAFGIALENIHPGEEKFVVMDGYICVFKRPGDKDMVFKVPERDARARAPDGYQNWNADAT